MTERLTRAQQQAQTREKLLDSAETLFGDKGIHQTSLDQIAANAGLTKGAIYANFSGKKELIAAIMQRKIDSDEPLRPRESAGSYIDMIGETWAAHVDLPETRRFAMALLELALHGLRDKSDTETLRQWLETVRAFHARDAASLGLGDDPQMVAATLLALDIGLALQHLIDPGAVPADSFAHATSALLNALRKPEEQPRQ
ncbi:TetR/AcrR family transcriptional regulator [Actinoplanes sp. TFC3]|uniref:TetR/AcrR family transcriptional regulator n=1 Tax=Actinoplanes sp. TFC3 TaxID=1710355 RepID=UPI000836D962|nr:TetR/AcrR family transcriptional regulator [Actinoplanes sp. TFC3]